MAVQESPVGLEVVGSLVFTTDPIYSLFYSEATVLSSSKA